MNFDAHRNSNGTYNGVTFFAELTGLPRAEIKWMFGRLKQLQQVEGKSKDEAVAIVKSERLSPHWKGIQA